MGGDWRGAARDWPRALGVGLKARGPHCKFPGPPWRSTPAAQLCSLARAPQGEFGLRFFRPLVASCRVPSRVALGPGPDQRPLSRRRGPRPGTHDLPQRPGRCAVSFVAPGCIQCSLLKLRDQGASSPWPASPPGLEAVFLANGEVSSYL